MGRILCPTRGGEGSYRTQDAAIAMAKERGDELVFLYVVDLDFLAEFYIRCDFLHFLIYLTAKAQRSQRLFSLVLIL